MDLSDFFIGASAVLILSVGVNYILLKTFSSVNEEEEEFEELTDSEKEIHTEVEILNKYLSDCTDHTDIYHPVYNPDGYGAGMENRGFVGGK